MEANVTLKELTRENIKKFVTINNKNYNADAGIEAVLSDKKFYNILEIKYGIIYNFDSVKYDTVDKLNIDFDNIIEARFFNKNTEVDVRMMDNKISGNIFIDNGEKELFIDENFYLRQNIENNYNKLKVKKYINFDEDGQAYVFYLKPCELLKEA
ncbi:hypothetical protein LN736_08680 [Clostridium sp. WLY-B-L2]|uniref:Uncharacterized protein n=1 Tax=Clostridium aromativorans TaxID=2836848 RepID=A0ABS8N538_9CLOT|nr:hypothetical protein [Clostridium aromativorans]MCC9294928.1 hypothetical protein [Clostridium aromativorans]